MLETDGTRTGDKRNLARGQESKPDIVCSLLNFSSQPPKEERKLG
jgi:hypothetical protein